MADTQVMAALNALERAARRLPGVSMALSEQFDDLRAAIAPSPAAEPVAGYLVDGEWTDAETFARIKYPEAHRITPLYAAPVTPPAGDAELRKALEGLYTRGWQNGRASDGSFRDEAVNDCLAALATSPSVPAQQGDAWICDGIPDEMIEAGCEAWDRARQEMEDREGSDQPEAHTDWDDGMIVAAIFKAMVRAATPPAQQGEAPCRHEGYLGQCCHCEISVKEYRAQQKGASGYHPLAEPLRRALMAADNLLSELEAHQENTGEYLEADDQAVVAGAQRDMAYAQAALKRHNALCDLAENDADILSATPPAQDQKPVEVIGIDAWDGPADGPHEQRLRDQRGWAQDQKEPSHERSRQGSDQ